MRFELRTPMRWPHLFLVFQRQAKREADKERGSGTAVQVMEDSQDGSERPAVRTNPRPSNADWAAMTTGQQKKWRWRENRVKKQADAAWRLDRTSLPFPPLLTPAAHGGTPEDSCELAG